MVTASRSRSKSPAVRATALGKARGSATFPGMEVPPKQRLETIDILRGLAALAVVIFHSTPELPPGGVKHLAEFGALGVQVFFVISGFILPFSLDRAGYTLSSYFRFVARRVMRLDPPYFASLAITLLLIYASSVIPGLSGIPFRLEPERLALHVGYLVGIAGFEWYNIVYWTLAIELQYYLLIGLLFPLIAHRNKIISIGVLVALAASSAVARNELFIFYWILPFILGMLTFRLKTSRIGIPEYLTSIAVAAGPTYYLLGPSSLAAALATALVIAFLTIRGNRSLRFLGAISYSLYLIHVPVAGRVVDLGERLSPGFGLEIAISLAAIAASIVAAWILYVAVERPAQRWASTMPLKSPSRKRDVSAQVEAALPGGP
jgi:peptidoglycan/LPS O-acetylase OafA/YrhL